jgi:hypothetical protein
MKYIYIYIYIYTFCVYALHVSATRASSGNTVLRSPLHCALCQILLVKYVIIISIIINFGVIECLFFLSFVLWPFCAASLVVSCVDLCSLYIVSRTIASVNITYSSRHATCAAEVFQSTITCSAS